MLHKKTLKLAFLSVLFCSMLALIGCSSSDSDSAAGSATSIQGTGIIWKPVSEGDGKLVVLLPASYGVEAVSIVTTDGTLVEEGRYVNRHHNNRPTYRFNSAGRGYPSPCVLKVGSSYYSIPSSAARYN